MSREDRRDAFYETIEYFKQYTREKHDYVIPGPIFYNQEILDAMLAKKGPPKRRFEKMEVFVENEDSFNMAKQLLDDKKTTSDKIMVLNMASAKHAGGGVRNGARAQEEDLFIRSNYFQHLTPDYYRLKNDELVVSRNIIVVKDDNLNLIDDHYLVNGIACSALVRPPVVAQKNGIENYKKSEHYDITYKKIYNIFLSSYAMGMEALVLGALGCGCFGNPPYAVAHIFLKVIKEFDGCFKHVGFAILSGKHNNNNYDIFKSQIEDQYNK